MIKDKILEIKECKKEISYNKGLLKKAKTPFERDTIRSRNNELNRKIRELSQEIKGLNY